MNKNMKTKPVPAGKNRSLPRAQIENKELFRRKWTEANDGMMDIFAEFAAFKSNGASVNSADTKALVAKLQAYITTNYYTCTNEILKVLGHMYVADEQFKKNIEKHGEGTAGFASKAIAVFCQEK